jgi:XTP/dITP diphosphohydrolase
MGPSFDMTGRRLIDLVEVMDRLRRECPWDQQQSHESLVRYLVEETYETVEAIESGDRRHLREELGDLLLQVVFHARIASEDPDDGFDIDDVAGGIVEKMIRRHPHVFAGTATGGDGSGDAADGGDVESLSADDVQLRWEDLKALEKSRESAVDGIPPGLPALSLADKVISRVRRSGRPLSVPAPSEPAYTADALGEVLFALVAAANAAGLDPEQALRRRVAQEVAAVRAGDQRGLTGDAGRPG